MVWNLIMKAYESQKDYEESNGIGEPFTPAKRKTGFKCEWKYPWNNDAVCEKELTERELKYCESHTEELDGKYLCFGHQTQLRVNRDR